MSGDLSFWSDRPLRELMRHIELEYHDCLRVELPQLILLAIDSAQDSLAPMLLRSLSDAVNRDFIQEEDFLFPAIRCCEDAAASQRQFPMQATAAVREGIQEVLRDHEQLANLFRGAREGAAGRLLEQLLWLEGEFQAHIRLEQEVLFARTVELFRPIEY